MLRSRRLIDLIQFLYIQEGRIFGIAGKNKFPVYIRTGKKAVFIYSVYTGLCTKAITIHTVIADHRRTE